MSERSEAKCKSHFGNGHSDSLLTKMNEFRKTGLFTDVVLNCESSRIAAHKNVLAAASPYFLAMFSGHFPESAQHEIELQEIDGEALKLVIDFIYTGHLAISDDCVQRLFETAAFLQLQEAVDMCAEYIVKHLLDVENCLGIKCFAEKQNNFLLLTAANDFIVTHFQGVVLSDEFLEIAYDELATILSHDALFVFSDDVVLGGLVRWAEHKTAERVPKLASLLRFIHPACVSGEMACKQPLLLQEAAGAQQWLSDVQHCTNNGGAQWRIFMLDKMGREPEVQRFDMRLDENQNEPKRLVVNAVVPLKPLPRTAFAISLAAHKNILYVQGGSVGRSTSESFYYNIYRDQWHDLQPLLLERSHHRSVVLNESLYALGGNSMQRATSAVECRNLHTDKGTFKRNMNAKRRSMGAVVCENAIYVMGGETDNRSLSTAERYDPREGLWHELPSMSKVDCYCSSAAIGSTQQIYCCAGLGNYMERYDLRANKWTPINLFEQREVYEIFTVDSQLFSISGEALSRYDMTTNQWLSVHEFEEAREWDTAIGLQMMNYSN